MDCVLLRKGVRAARQGLLTGWGYFRAPDHRLPGELHSSFPGNEDELFMVLSDRTFVSVFLNLFGTRGVILNTMMMAQS
jgi:hypothetical protein